MASLRSSQKFERGLVNKASPSRSKPVKRSTSITNNKPHSNDHHNDQESGRVRVGIRLRPRNAEDLSDADFASCVELQPELRRLILRKNNWSSESYRFDEVFNETASQKRVYDVVAKPVVESVINGYNGTVMAYGQTGTGKTYTVGRLGKDDASERGIMVRALEDIIASTSPDSDSIEISFLQLYMEYIQDLLAPEKNNIPINEDSKTGEVSLPGTEVVKIQNIDHFLQLLRIGEANRHAANTKLNTESSRSHAILMVYVRRRIQDKEEDDITSKTKKDTTGHVENCIPIVRKSKLLIVDLAGSERVNKSGSKGLLLEEAKFINLSLTSLGKCINALAENSPHIPTRDSKLTRLLRDSFGGSAMTSLIVTIGPSARYYAETASTIMFGQRAMKIVNMVKLKEEFDYESLCRKLENQVDHLTAEVERQEKLRENDKQEFEKKLRQCQESYAETEKQHVIRSELFEKENDRLKMEMKQLCSESTYQKGEYDLMRNTVAQLEISLEQSKLFEKENVGLEMKMKQLCNELHYQKEQNNLMHDTVAQLEMSLNQSKQQQLENSSLEKVLAETTTEYEKKISGLITQFEDEHHRYEITAVELAQTKKLLSTCQKSIQQLEKEVTTCKKEFANATLIYERKILELKKQLEEECTRSRVAEQQLQSTKNLLAEHKNSMQGQTELEGKLQEMSQLHEHTLDELESLKLKYTDVSQEKVQTELLEAKLQEMSQLHEHTLDELESLKLKYTDVSQEKAILNDELHHVRQQLVDEQKEREAVEAELVKLKKTLKESEKDAEDKRPYIGKGSLIGTQDRLHKPNPIRDTLSGQRATITKLCEEVGLPKILELLKSDDPEVQIQAVKVVANLAAEDAYQEKIVEEGGLDALLVLLQSSQHTTILRVASGALANLAMNEFNQALIMAKGGAQLLASIALNADDPQTLRMIAGAIANFCGNEKMHPVLKNHGCLKALLEMVRCGNNDVIAQVARGIANFAKCESREIIQGHKKSRSLLIKEGVLAWLIANSDIASASSRRHIELALCHLAQNEDNADDFISSGALKELSRISIESSREDIRTLAKKSLKLSPRLQAMCTE